MVEKENAMEQISEWLLCPRCGSKTKVKIRQDTKLENFPLFCPKCKTETVISVEKLKLKMD